MRDAVSNFAEAGLTRDKDYAKSFQNALELFMNECKSNSNIIIIVSLVVVYGSDIGH